MRSLRLMLIVTSISIICILCCSLVSALEPDEASVSLSWTSGTIYQGDTAPFRITLKSNSADQLRIYNIGLQFDWMPSDSFSGPDLSDNPVIIPSYGTHTFDLWAIDIPLNVSVGSHSYFVGVDGTQGLSASIFTWDSPPLTIQIYSPNEKVYTALMSQVTSKLNAANNATYESSEAQSLLQQAQSEYNLAQSSANEGKWTEAIISLQNTASYVEQANEAEQKSDEQKAQQQNLLFYLAIIAIAVIIAVAIIIVVRKKRKQAAVADQSLEIIEEQS